MLWHDISPPTLGELAKPLINITNVSGCGRQPTSRGSCDSVLYSTHGIQYSQVCGRIIAYQYGVPEGFVHYVKDIDSYYIHGLSLTHGSKHVWTFVNARDETTHKLNWLCPCMLSNSTKEPPSFVQRATIFVLQQPVMSLPYNCTHTILYGME